MSYLIRQTSGNLLTTVNDFTTDVTSSSITLVGRGVPNIGGVIASDLIQMIENFAYTAPPNAPLDGQLWFNTNSNNLEIKY